MAIAPLNKFITVAVPVAPGEQTVYKTPVGVSAILLYAQVSNVGIGRTYPKVTLSHKRVSTATKTAGNVRTNRLIRNVEIPPNDAVILVDGRIILERTAVISDSIVLDGVQSGIVSIFDCQYDNVTGLTTITTYDSHNFSIGDEITMSGLEFTCSGSIGITTTIFPSPQVAFTISNVGGGGTVFETYGGTVAGIAHTYVGGGLVGPLQMEFICSVLENSTI